MYARSVRLSASKNSQFQIERETLPGPEQTGEGFLFRLETEILNLSDRASPARGGAPKLSFYGPGSHNENA